MKCPYCLENFHVKWYYPALDKHENNCLKEGDDFFEGNIGVRPHRFTKSKGKLFYQMK